MSLCFAALVLQSVTDQKEVTSPARAPPLTSNAPVSDRPHGGRGLYKTWQKTLGCAGDRRR